MLNGARLSSRTTRLLLFTITFVLFSASIAPVARAETKPAASALDTVTFINGDQLTGKLIKVLSGTVTFHSDIVGDISVPWAKIKTLHTAQPFAVVEKNEKVTRKTAPEKVAVGPISVEDNTLRVSSSTTRTIPVNQAADLIDAPSFHKEISGESSSLYGWNGSLTLGASLVEGTNNSQTFTGAIAFVRNIPTTAWLPPASKTSLNLSGTYGLATDPTIISGTTVIQTASTSKTDILHGDTEYDKYLSPQFFALVNASADHNFGSGLELQQAYGGGFGWALFKSPKNELDLKTDLHYEEQQFYDGVISGLGTPDENLIVADLTESWAHTFNKNIKFNEYVTLTPAFNVVQAFSGAANANLVLPLYKKFNFTLTSTDNYLGDPPQGYLRNSFQFNAGITYTLK
jgi:hypothetical protein